jgi:exoribonuclease R
LTLETLEAQAVFHEGALADLVLEGPNRAKDLIEDLMIAANGATARFLEDHRFPSLRRVLRSPGRWAKIVALAGSLGEELPAEPSIGALESFLQRRREQAPSRFADLSLSVVKLLGRGEYVLELPGEPVPGHFGLALQDYTHSTTPNRRFADLVTHRLLKAALAGAPAPYSIAQLVDWQSIAPSKKTRPWQAARSMRQTSADRH